MIITCKSIQKTKTNYIDCQKNRIALLIIDYPSHIAALALDCAFHVAFCKPCESAIPPNDWNN